MQWRSVLKSWRWRDGDGWWERRMRLLGAIENRGLSPFVPNQRPKRVRLARSAMKWLLLSGLVTMPAAVFAEAEEPPPPQSILDSLPPLPPPTEAQLRRGRELLDKIVYVVDNVPLTDAPAVLKVFGFTDLHVKEYPTHVDVVPRGREGGHYLTQDLRGTGFSSLTVNPQIKADNEPLTARFAGALVPEEVCIPIDEVRRIFTPKAARVSRGHHFVAGFVERPRRVHTTGYLSFLLTQNRFTPNASIAFSFDYQTCAARVSFSYRVTSMETDK